MDFLFSSNYIYYITIALQAICVFHCLKNHNENRWIWIIVFLPMIGCIIYFFSEIVNGRNVQKIGTDVNAIINPGSSVRKRQEQLRFADTFENKIALADAYLQKGQTEEAIQLYEQSLTGVFDENEYGIMQLILAYAKAGRYESIIPLAKKVYRSPQFAKSPAHIAYAKALAATGQESLAEAEYKSMNSRFANFEPRYYYGLFLKQANRTEDAKTVFSDIMSEADHLSTREKRYHRIWFQKSKEELGRL